MTTPLPPDPTHDDDLPDDAGLKALYGRLPTAEPSPALDAAIRQAAARAVQGGQPTVHARRRRRWPIALGSAATIMLAAGLAWHMREMPTRESSSPSAPATAAIEAARNDEAGVPAGADITRPHAREAPAMKAVANPTAMAADQAGPSAPPHPAMARRAPAPVAAPHASESMAPASTPAATPMPRGQTRASAADALEVAPMPAPAAPVAPAPPAPPAPPSASPAFAPMSAPVPGADAISPSVAPGPAMELDAIRVLYAKGETVEADKRLHAFHNSHPDWPLPDDLRRHLDRTP